MSILGSSNDSPYLLRSILFRIRFSNVSCEWFVVVHPYAIYVSVPKYWALLWSINAFTTVLYSFLPCKLIQLLHVVGHQISLNNLVQVHFNSVLLCINFCNVDTCTIGSFLAISLLQHDVNIFMNSINDIILMYLLCVICLFLYCIETIGKIRYCSLLIFGFAHSALIMVACGYSQCNRISLLSVLANTNSHHCIFFMLKGGCTRSVLVNTLHLVWQCVSLNH